MAGILETLRAELADAIELTRAVFPDISDAAADKAAYQLRWAWIYPKVRWPTVDEVRAYWKAEGRWRALGVADPDPDSSSVGRALRIALAWPGGLGSEVLYRA
jgi:hypothetical protein